MFKAKKAKFSIGQVVYHKIFNYRGVILDVDSTYQNDDLLYEMMAKSKPPKDEPWYLILVDDADYSTYVSEQHLEADESGLPISHPAVERYFNKFEKGLYIAKQRFN